MFAVGTIFNEMNSMGSNILMKSKICRKSTRQKFDFLMKSTMELKLILGILLYCSVLFCECVFFMSHKCSGNAREILNCCRDC